MFAHMWMCITQRHVKEMWSLHALVLPSARITNDKFCIFYWSDRIQLWKKKVPTMGENVQQDRSCNARISQPKSQADQQTSSTSNQTPAPIQQATSRFADYFVICGLDLDTGLEADRFAGKCVSPRYFPSRQSLIWQSLFESLVLRLVYDDMLFFTITKNNKEQK